MKEYLFASSVFLSIILFVFSLLIMPCTLINDNLVYGCVLISGIIFSIVYILIYKNSITDTDEYLYIPIRSIISFGAISVFLFILLNYHLRNSKEVKVKTPVISSYLDESTKGGKFSSRLVIKSAFVVDYEGQTKNIIWNSRLEDSIMENVNAIELKVNKGFFGYDIIQDIDLIFVENNLKQ